jgi:hypothetical protein
MILDHENIYSENQAVTTTTPSTKKLELQEDIGVGNPVNLLVQVTEDFVGCTSVQAVLQTCDTENGAYTDVLMSGAIPVAQLKAGYRFAIPALAAPTKAFTRFSYVVVGTATAGAITAAVTPDVQTNM